MTNNILLIEDSPTDAAIFIASFEDTGYSGNIQVSHNGIEALSYLKNLATPQHPDWPQLIVIDLNLPITNGLDILETIKTNQQWKSTPTVVLSSSSSPTDIQNSYQRYANAYISKPKQLEQYKAIANSLYTFWFQVAQPSYSE